MSAVKSVRENVWSSISPAQSHRINVKRILVVEDESEISRVLNEILMDWGFDVLTAFNGREGLDVLNSQTVDGIVLDLEMPIMDGWTMLDELRWQGYQTPVIVMSGGVDPHVLRNMLREGAQGFLVKPFTIETLSSQCQRCFRENRAWLPLESNMVSVARVVSTHKELA